MKKRRRRCRYRVIQTHHSSYDPPKTRLLFQSEHHIVTRLRRLEKSKPSLAFLDIIQQFWLSKMFADEMSYSEREMERLRKENQTKRRHLDD